MTSVRPMNGLFLRLHLIIRSPRSLHGFAERNMQPKKRSDVTSMVIEETRYYEQHKAVEINVHVGMTFTSEMHRFVTFNCAPE